MIDTVDELARKLSRSEFAIVRNEVIDAFYNSQLSEDDYKRIRQEIIYKHGWTLAEYEHRYAKHNTRPIE